MAPRADPELEALIDYVRDNRGFDFTGYKRASLSRRIQKRVDALRLDGFAAYRHHLEREPSEFAELFNTILINVTSFFRDGEPWEALQQTVLPRIVESSGPRDPLRVWVAGCASGEEAYTVAVILCQVLGEEAFRTRVKIYATDVDTDALSVARHARFPKRQLDEQLAGSIIEQFFEVDASHAVFRSDLRRSIIFGRHDLVQDPPISRIDLLTCRNTLMYFTGAAQARILQQLHFALKPTGFLLLGRSEALATRTNLFQPFDLKRRLFVKTERTVNFQRPMRPSATDGQEIRMESSEADIRSDAFDMSPAAQIVIDNAGRVAGINQQARMLFNINARDVGRPLQDLEVSYRPLELRSQLETALAERRQVVVRGVVWPSAPQSRWFDVVISPLTGITGTLEGASASFIEVTALRRAQDELDRSRTELETAYEELQSTVEELETTNEELQSTNEELETTNEELQSTNEELETMNEELQSTNEELETMNDELRLRTDELNDVNVFLEAILASLQSAVVVVDRDMRVQVWNHQAADMWGMRADEVEGAHLMNIDIGLPLELLRQPIRAAISGDVGDTETELDAVNRRGRAVRCRVRATPLRQPDGEPVGVILLIDATDGAGSSAP